MRSLLALLSLLACLTLMLEDGKGTIGVTLDRDVVADKGTIG